MGCGCGRNCAKRPNRTDTRWIKSVTSVPQTYGPSSAVGRQRNFASACVRCAVPRTQGTRNHAPPAPTRELQAANTGPIATDALKPIGSLSAERSRACECVGRWAHPLTKVPDGHVHVQLAPVTAQQLAILEEHRLGLELCHRRFIRDLAVAAGGRLRARAGHVWRRSI